MNKIKILVADDHPAFRDGLCRFLEDEEDMDVVARATDGEEAIRLARELEPDVAILDIAMPKLSGIDAARQMKVDRPATAILMVSAYGYESYVIAALRGGATGYMLKSASLGDLVNAVRMVNAGQAVFDLKATNRIMSRLITVKGEKLVSQGELYSRELEILKETARGKSNREIAGELAISERTVQSHLANIFRKLEVKSRTEAVLRALKEGWLSLDDLV